MKITGTEDDPKIEFTCKGDDSARCHHYPSCECEVWDGSHQHPDVQQSQCWMKDWFDNACTDPFGGEWGTLADCKYRVGMEGPITTSFQTDYLEWEFVK